MFNFFHTVFDVLKTQMGAEYVEHAVQTFLNLFGQNQLTQVERFQLDFSVLDRFPQFCFAPVIVQI